MGWKVNSSHFRFTQYHVPNTQSCCIIGTQFTFAESLKVSTLVVTNSIGVPIESLTPGPRGNLHTCSPGA